MKKRQYILQHFFSVYQIPEKIKSDLILPSPSKLKWVDHSEKFYKSEKPFLVEAREEIWNGHRIPFPFAEENVDLIEIKGGVAHINFDVFTASFMLLSGWQEDKQSGLGSRLSHRDLWQYRFKCIRIPVVNYYFDVLKVALEKAWGVEIELKKESTTVYLSHDIERVKGGWRNNMWNQVKSFNIGNIIWLISKRLVGKDVWNNLDFILDLEESYEVRSTLFLMGRKGKTYADYNLLKKPFNGWVKGFQGRGFEVGILSSNGSHNSAHKLGHDLKQLKYKIYGNRFQSLRYRTKKSARAIEKNKMVYDSSLGLFNEIGYRNGYCHPFIPWDFGEDRPAGYLEIPINLLDIAITSRKYLNIIPKDAVNVFGLLAQQSKKFNGIVGISWSNIQLSDFENKEWRKAYERIIKSALEEGFKFKTGYQVTVTSKENGLEA